MACCIAQSGPSSYYLSDCNPRFLPQMGFHSKAQCRAAHAGYLDHPNATYSNGVLQFLKRETKPSVKYCRNQTTAGAFYPEWGFIPKPSVAQRTLGTTTIRRQRTPTEFYNSYPPPGDGLTVPPASSLGRDKSLAGTFDGIAKRL